MSQLRWFRLGCLLITPHWEGDPKNGRTGTHKWCIWSQWYWTFIVLKLNRQRCFILENNLSSGLRSVFLPGSSGLVGSVTGCRVWPYVISSFLLSLQGEYLWCLGLGVVTLTGWHCSSSSSWNGSISSFWSRVDKKQEHDKHCEIKTKFGYFSIKFLCNDNFYTEKSSKKQTYSIWNSKTSEEMCCRKIM